MTEFKVTRRELVVEFAVQTTDTVTTYSGTEFVPNHCTARVHDGQIISLTLEKRDDGGWGIDDPAGPRGAELSASYGGGEFLPENLHKLLDITRRALVEVYRLL